MQAVPVLRLLLVERPHIPDALPCRDLHHAPVFPAKNLPLTRLAYSLVPCHDVLSFRYCDFDGCH